MTHLSYDGNRNNGIIFNEAYPNGALYVGAEFKPVLSFEYDSMQYSEIVDTFNSVTVGKNVRVMTAEEDVEVQGIATLWVQAVGQKGNPLVDPVEVALVNGVYQKHVDRSGNSMNEFRGLSYIDNTYNVQYTSDNVTGGITSERPNGKKTYTPHYTTLPAIIEQFGIIPFLIGGSGNTQEYYLPCTTYEEVVNISDTLQLPMPFTDEQRELLETKAYAYALEYAGVFNTSINLVDGVPTHLVGFMTMTKEEIGTMFSIDVDSYVVPPLPVFNIKERK